MDKDINLKEKENDFIKKKKQRKTKRKDNWNPSLTGACICLNGCYYYIMINSRSWKEKKRRTRGGDKTEAKQTGAVDHVTLQF